jgi:hypothetical protein
MRLLTVLIFSLLIIGVPLLCLTFAGDAVQPEKGVYDGSGGLAYYMKGDALYSPNWDLQYYIRGTILYDKNWKRYGVIKGSDIYDDHQYLRYRIKEWKLPEKPEP